MTDRGEEVNTVELAIISLEYASLDHTKYLDHFCHVFIFLVQWEKMQHQFLIVVVCGGSLPPK